MSNQYSEMSWSEGTGGVVFIDSKGEVPHFHAIQAEAKAESRSFHWHANVGHSASCVVNPLMLTLWRRAHKREDPKSP